MDYEEIVNMTPTRRRQCINQLSEDERYGLLNYVINHAKHTVFFGGAGVSTESGIPDFRSKDGLYNQHDVQFDAYTPEYLLSHDCLYRESKVFFEYYRQKMNVEGIKPNRAHEKLAEMEAKGKLDCVITQNIDGLHQKAGSKKVYEIHGSTMRNYCVGCGTKYPEDFIFKNTQPVPLCPKCGKMIRPDVTMYGESLPDVAFMNAQMAVMRADCLIVGGTSLMVYPAAGLVTNYNGDFLILINKDVTAQDRYADLVFHDSIGKVMSRIKVD